MPCRGRKGKRCDAAGRPCLVVLYVARTFSQSEEPRPDMEIAAHLWVQWTDLPPDATPATRRRVDEALRGFPVSDMW